MIICKSYLIIPMNKGYSCSLTPGAHFGKSDQASPNPRYLIIHSSHQGLS